MPVTCQEPARDLPETCPRPARNLPRRSGGEATAHDPPALRQRRALIRHRFDSTDGS